MRKTRRALALFTAAALSASAFSGLAISANAEDTEPAVAKAVLIPTKTGTAKIYFASYDGERLATVMEGEELQVTEGTPVEVEADAIGVKVMLWGGEQGMEPYSEAVLAAEDQPPVPATEAPEETQTPAEPTQAPEEPTQAPEEPTQAPEEPTQAPEEPTQAPEEPTQAPEEPTQAPEEPTQAPEEPTQAPEETQAPAENKVYIDEPFTYDDHQIIKSTGNDVENAPDPVTLGSFTYAAGHRPNGPISDYAKIDSGKLVINATNFATSGRGVLFTFADGAVPAAADLADGQVLEMSFDVKTSGAFEVTGYGNVTTNDLTTDQVKARIILDKGANEQYLIVTDPDGKFVNSTVAPLTAATFSGMSFRVGTAWVEIDNLKVETKDKDFGTVTFSVKDADGAAVSDAAVKITDTYSVTTGADGTAVAALPNGSYSTEASKSGYEHTKGVNDNDKADVTVASSAAAVEFTLSAMSYDKIPETITIENGQVFVAAPKTAEPNKTAPFTVKVLDQYGIEMTPEEYTLEWSILPEGSDNADNIVAIDENGVVSVAQSFSADNSVKTYEITAGVTANNAGLRSGKGTKVLAVGNNDVIYYEPIAWSEAAGSRGNTKNLASAVKLPDISSITLDLTMQEPEGQRTLFLLTNTGNFVGLQYQKATGNIVVGTGWSGNSAFNQSGDVDRFTNQETLITGYASNTPFTVNFVIDKSTNTITASSGASTVSVPFVAASPETFTGFKTGLYRNYGAMTMSAVMVREPDNNYLSVTGDADFAKIGNTTIEKEYALGQSVLVPGETFEWKVEPASEAVTIADGKLSVTDAATPGNYKITATSTINAEKTASIDVTIGDFQTFTNANTVVTGAHAYDINADKAGKYSIVSAVDSFGDDVISKLNNIVWTSSNEAVATITADGDLEVKGAGNTEVKATITNGTAVSEITVPVTVAAYYITADAAGNSTSVDTSALVSDPAIAGYQVTTSNGGKLVKQEIVSTAPSSVDTTGADKVEIAPVFELSGVSSSASKSIAIPADTYNFKLSGASGDRFDVYVNDQMLANNMLQGGSAVTNIDVNDIVVSEGYANINLRDYPKTPSLGKVQIVKAPSIVDRVKKVYVLGDSLVCIYANGGDATHNYQTGLGQVLQSYMTDDVEVVDLGNSGVIAEGLATSAITQVAKSGQKGDIMLLESGYNDRTYTTQDKMKAALVSMYNDATAAEVTPIFMTPPASAHDYNPNVVWSGVMRSTAAELEVPVVDLAAVSYEFLNSTYGESFSDATVYSVYNVSDRLHSTFHGANKMASLVATEMAKLGYGDIVNDAYSYSFTDSNNNTITCKAEK